MIAFPVLATLASLAAAAFLTWDALNRPRPERVIWAIAFLVFAIAAGSEVIGSTLGWTATLARVYYLTGAVLVVGLLALGEMYLLFGARMPAVTPGITLLVVALAATTVWSAPVDPALLASEGWAAIERGPLLVALAASINAGGTLVLAGGALYSAWKMRGASGLRRRAFGCLLIALGTVAVAMGGTLTRFGHREYLYLAMAIGISIIFAGVMLTRSKGARRATGGAEAVASPDAAASARPASLAPVPMRPARSSELARESDGIRFIVDHLLPMDEAALATACHRWSATAIAGEALTRGQAVDVWALRGSLPEEQRAQFDRLPLPLQAQLAELYLEVWSSPGPAVRDARQA